MEDHNNLSQVSSDVSIAVCSAGLDLAQWLLLLPWNKLTASLLRSKEGAACAWPLNSTGAFKRHIHVQIFFKLVPSSRVPIASKAYF